MSKEKWNFFERCLTLNRSRLKAPVQRITFTFATRSRVLHHQTTKTGNCCAKVSFLLSESHSYNKRPVALALHAQ